jgi:hypothetical protein
MAESWPALQLSKIFSLMNNRLSGWKGSEMSWAEGSRSSEQGHFLSIGFALFFFLSVAEAATSSLMRLQWRGDRPSNRADVNNASKQWEVSIWRVDFHGDSTYKSKNYVLEQWVTSKTEHLSETNDGTKEIKLNIFQSSETKCSLQGPVPSKIQDNGGTPGQTNIISWGFSGGVSLIRKLSQELSKGQGTYTVCSLHASSSFITLKRLPLKSHKLVEWLQLYRKSLPNSCTEWSEFSGSTVLVCVKTA